MNLLLIKFVQIADVKVVDSLHLFSLNQSLSLLKDSHYEWYLLFTFPAYLYCVASYGNFVVAGGNGATVVISTNGGKSKQSYGSNKIWWVDWNNKQQCSDQPQN